MRPSNPNRSVNRRRFLAVSAGVTAVGVAGCTDGVTNIGSDSTTVGSAATAPFSLLITDAPADIDDFESLNVTFDHARVFRAEDDDDDDEDRDDNEDDPGDDEDDRDDDNDDGDDRDGDADEEGRDWFILDIEGQTVDLTEVVGDVADPVSEGELDVGTYSKIELHVADVDATLTDDESADVKVPSEKLQLTKEFEVVEDEPLAFVYDINVVKKGLGNEYNLLPVVDGSGVNGKDVAVERRDEADPGDNDDADGEEESADEGDGDEGPPGEGGENGPPDDQGGD